MNTSLPSIKFVAVRGGMLLLLVALLTASLGFPAANVLAATVSAGAFMAHPTTPLFATDSAIPNDVVLGDLDGDLDLDAVVVEGDPTLPDTVWLNNGLGVFTFDANLPYDVTQFGDSRNGRLADFNGDGDLDILISNFVDPIEEYIWFNDGAGNFPAGTKFNSYNLTHWAAAGSLSGDTDVDVFTANGISDVGVFENSNGAGTMTLLHNYPSGGAVVNYVALANIDTDSDLDAIISSNFGFTINTNDGAGAFAQVQYPYNQATNVILTGTLDGNAGVDLIAGRPAGTSMPAGAQLYTNNGTGTFAPSGGLISTNTIVSGDIGDIDGDDDLDVVLANSNSANDEIFVNNGSGVFSANPRTPSVAAGVDTRAARLGDIDGDGDLDLLTTVVNGTDSGVNVWINNAVPVIATIPDQNGAVGSPFSIDLDDYVSDLDLETLTLTLGIGEQGAIDTLTHVYSWTPTAPFGGTTETVNFRAKDLQVEVLGSFRIVVTGVNNPPVVGAIPDQATNEGVALTPALNLALYVTDPESSPLTFSSPSRGALTSAGMFTWTPGESEILASGDVTVTFQVTDGVNPVQGSFVVNVTETNQDPVVGTIADRNASEGTQLSFDLDPFVSDGDIPTQTFTFALTPPSVGAIDPTTHVFTWTPSETHGGSTVTVNFTVTDTMGGSDTGTFDINVAEINQLPVLDVPVSGSYTALSQIEIVVSGHDADDNPADTLTYGYTGSLPAGAVFDAPTHTLTWTPTVAQVGDHVITFTINDGHGVTSFDVTFTILDQAHIYLPLLMRAP